MKEEQEKFYDNDQSFYHIVTGLICLAVIVVAAAILLAEFLIKSNKGEKYQAEYENALEYNDAYFSDKILKGVTVSGYDVGEMNADEAKELLNGCVDFNISVDSLVLSYGDKKWEIDKDTLNLTIDVDYAVEKALLVGRKGTAEEKREALATLQNGSKIDVSATVIKDHSMLLAKLKEIKKEIDIEKKDAYVTVKFSGSTPQYTYTDEADGLELDLNKTYKKICSLLSDPKPILELTLEPDVIKPGIKRSDIEGNYSLVGKYTTYLSSSSAAGRINNIKTALLSLNEQTWMPGETFSFNEWVGARTIESGYAEGVFINEQQQYDTTVGGGICQVSTTVYNCALTCGANAIGTNAPIEIVERRPHTWPSEYVEKGLDATVSWPGTDLKMYNNNKTPYFIHTYITESKGRIYVNVEFYGAPLPNNAKIKIETEIVEEIPAAEEILEDTTNQYALSDGQKKETRKAHNGYKINLYQIWTEPGKDPVKSLITVSTYNVINSQVYVNSATKAALDAQAAAMAGVAENTPAP